MTLAADPDDGVTTDGVEARLARYGVLTRGALEERLPAGQPQQWLFDLVREYPSRPAKYLRPAITLATCEAFGGHATDALLLGVAIELFHNAFLVHDDIADGSLRRRGRPTLHAAHGIGLAVNAGDALGMLAHRSLRDALDRHPPVVADRLVEEFDTMLARTVEGQAVELGWVRDVITDLGPEDYLDLIMHKTCWYTTVHPLRVGALAGSRGTADVTDMVRFGFYLGAAFQIRDDVLNLIGDEGDYGKEIGGDLLEGKRTLMLLHLLAEARGADARRLDAYLRLDRSERNPEMAAEVRAMMDRHGSIEFALDYAEGIGAAATAAFEAAFARARPNAGREFVADLIPYMLERTS